MNFIGNVFCGDILINGLTFNFLAMYTRTFHLFHLWDIIIRCVVVATGEPEPYQVE